MKQIRIELEDQTYSIAVEELDSIQKMQIASRAPDELQEVAGMEKEEAMETMSVSDEMLDFLTYVATEATEFDEDALAQLPVEAFLEITTAILETALGDPEDVGDQTGRRLRRVRCTKEFVECLFTEKMAIVAGMPDDASFENFDYDPARNEFHFIFSSDEWESIAEGAEIPCHEAYGVGFGDSTKELPTADLPRR